ncbi:hypothetical protein CXB49_09280 [Chromobacterium sp. ATCC 53434]|uniref:aerolysin family beta-barrel pore-forming toxin n=1 Tax=Chromobacterium TaxID=535 RepID=UPI000C768BF2|nr:aerolysin family beta-barrel pore-forming toxin [Chromobacterium sp. ATCC 53434]AUH50988.1 hypothetical protein CXB49_09280 [Chromobacterium sp. ATCC 53434]
MKLAINIISSVISLVISQSYAWGSDEIPQYDDVVFTEPAVDNESTIQKIVTHDSFLKPWANLANIMGYAWSSGNTNQNTEVGNEFEYRRINTKLDDLSTPDTKYRYMLIGKYDPNGPEGYWADKRLRMAFSNIQWKTAPGEIQLKTPELYNKRPIKTVNVLLENHGDTEDAGVANLKYESMTSWSKADKIAVTGKVTLTNTWNASLPLLAGTNASVAVEIESGADWTTTNGTTTTISQSAEYQAQLPAKTKRLITLTLYEEKANIPYTSTMYMSYEAELYNFLRYSGNALNTHPTDRPFHLTQFGGRDGLNATQDLLSQYRTPASSEWDWLWMKNRYTLDYVRYVIGTISSPKFKQQFKGTFTAVDSTGYTITAGPPVPLSTSLRAQTKNGIQYRVLSDISDVPGSVKNLRFMLKKPLSTPSPASPF